MPYIFSIIFLACNCDEQGSVNLECNDQGECQCKRNVVGNKCDQCKAGYYGRYTGEHLKKLFQWLNCV